MNQDRIQKTKKINKKLFQTKKKKKKKKNKLFQIFLTRSSLAIICNFHISTITIRIIFRKLVFYYVQLTHVKVYEDNTDVDSYVIVPVIVYEGGQLLTYGP